MGLSFVLGVPFLACVFGEVLSKMIHGIALVVSTAGMVYLIFFEKINVLR